MHAHWLRHAAFLAALAVAGCGGGKVETPDISDNETRLGDKIDIDLVAAFQQPRREQAKLAEEWAETVRTQLEAIRQNPESVELLPRILPPLAVPVFHQAKFSPAAGFSLPSYLEPGAKDAAVAVHLARFGDHEAAAKLAPDDIRASLASFQTGKNYPVEWTRLAGLTLISSQLKLALGEPDGATQIVLLHRQIASVLDPKALEGRLGSVLLSAGKRALERAEAAWREPKRTKTALADDIRTALGEWTKVTAPAPALPFAASTAEVSALFGVAARGKAVIADKPASIARVVDLLGLPLPGEGVQVAVAFLDAKGRLAEWELAYRPKVDTLYPSCAHVAYRLLEAGYEGGEAKTTANLARQAFTAGDVACEVVRTDRSLALGGQVRILPRKGGDPPVANRGFRDYGPVSLDRGFEASRLALSPREAGAPLFVKDEAARKAMAAVLETPVPETLLLLRDGQADVLDVFEMAWPSTENGHALDRLLPSIWDDFGPGVLEEVEDQAGAYLAYRWQDATTRVRLRFAFDDRGPVLSVKDTQGPGQLAARVKAARERDEKERQARLSEGKPDLRLPRSPGLVNDLSVAGLRLGQPKAEAEKALPAGRSYRGKAVPGGVSVVMLTIPDRTASHWARQLLVRYRAGKVSEIRVRYQTGLAKAKKGESLLERLSDAKAGAPESLTPSWNGLWADLPHPGKIVYQSWRDDRTVRTYQQDAGGIEVTWLDRAALDDSLTATPWQFVERGVPGCGLDDKRAAVEAALRGPATSSGDAAVYRLPATSLYEMALVWYEGDRVSRILAVHRQRPGGTQPKEVEQALSAAWGRTVDALGFICRQEDDRGKVLGSYFWHDDRVRVETFVRQDDEGLRLLTEWRYWPIAKARAVARPGELD
jgi:hypothetical protein